MSHQFSQAVALALLTVNLLPAAASRLVPSLAPSLALAFETPAFAAQANDQLTFLGEINADNSFLRSGPSTDQNNYPVYRLDKGATVVVVGIRDNWLQVIPPEGAFCVIDKADLERRGEGNGRVIRADGALVRIGSTIVPSRYKISNNRLEKAVDVKIIGEEQDFFKVAPPQGIYFWVERASVTPVKRLDANDPVLTQTPAGNQQPNPPAITPDDANRFQETSDGSTNPGPNPAGTNPPVADTSGSDSSVPTNPTPVDPTNTTVAPGNPATDAVPNPGVREIQDKLAKLEDDYVKASRLPITEQPVDSLIAGYTELSQNPATPPNAKQVVDFRLKALAVRKDALEQFKAVQQIRDDMNTRQDALQIEEKELRDRAEATKVTRFTALGKLATSSLQSGSQTLYRLVDPVTGRTVVYLRTNDPNVAVAMDKFVGVTGEVVTDDQISLTYITPTKIEQVDPLTVNVRVFAEFTPPSMLASNLAPVGEVAPTPAASPEPAPAPTKP